MGRLGRHDELERLYRTRYEKFVRVAWAIVGDEAGARDAVQEGFARALKGLKGFSGRGELEGWVWRIIVNAALSARSKALPAGEPEEHGAADAEAGDEDIRRWIARLPERQRLAVFLRYYADLDYAAIGAALGVERGTVSATLSAAHTALRRQLEEVKQ